MMDKRLVTLKWPICIMMLERIRDPREFYEFSLLFDFNRKSYFDSISGTTKQGDLVADINLFAS